MSTAFNPPVLLADMPQRAAHLRLQLAAPQLLPKQVKSAMPADVFVCCRRQAARRDPPYQGFGRVWQASVAIEGGGANSQQLAGCLAMLPCSRSAYVTRSCAPALRRCSCAPGGKLPFRTCTLKRVGDIANPAVWDDSTDWTSGVVA